jgi:hypothetical protein
MHGQDRVLVCAFRRKTAEAIDGVPVQFPLRQAHADRGGTQSVFGQGPSLAPRWRRRTCGNCAFRKAWQRGANRPWRSAVRSSPTGEGHVLFSTEEDNGMTNRADKSPIQFVGIMSVLARLLPGDYSIPRFAEL